MSKDKVTDINQAQDTAEQTKETTTDTKETTTENARDNNLVLILKRPFIFEGKEYKEIDLNGLEDLNGKSMQKIDRIFRNSGGAGTYSKEIDSRYLQLVSMEATGKPQEFFEALHIKDATALEIKVRNFLIV